MLGSGALRRDGGSDANIARILASDQIGDCPDGRTWAVIAVGWFVVADDQTLLRRLHDGVDGDVSDVRAVSPIPSYTPPGCA